MPRVSVITPVLNAAEFLSDAIASLRWQTLANWEHILVDDGSTDGSLELIKMAVSTDPRMQLLRSRGHSGPAKARNLGLEAASGDYVAFLDADDLWLPEKLDHCVSWMDSNDYDFVYHDYRLVSQDGKKIGAVIAGPDRLDSETLHTRRGVGCLTVVLSRRRIQDFRFPEDHKGLNEDFVAWLRLLRGGHTGYRLPEDLARHRLSGTSRNANRLASAAACWRIYRDESDLPFGIAVKWWVEYAWRSFWMHRRAAPR